MANRRFEQFQLSLEKKVVSLFLKVSFGATGAPTIVRGKGIVTITRVSAGKYTIAMGSAATPTPDTYQLLLSAQHSFLNATAPAAPGMYVTSDASATGSVQVQFNAAGVATDPGNGETVMIRLMLSNSSL